MTTPLADQWCHSCGRGSHSKRFSTLALRSQRVAAGHTSWRCAYSLTLRLSDDVSHPRVLGSALARTLQSSPRLTSCRCRAALCAPTRPAARMLLSYLVLQRLQRSCALCNHTCSNYTVPPYCVRCSNDTLTVLHTFSTPYRTVSSVSQTGIADSLPLSIINWPVVVIKNISTVLIYNIDIMVSMIISTVIFIIPVCPSICRT